MVSQVFRCPHCEESERVRRYGRTKQGSERLCCNVCRRAFTPAPKSRALSEEKQAMILRALAEKTPLIAICRTFKVSPKTVYALLEKVEALPPLSETLLPYEGHDELILDELWSFVGAKCRQAWVWIVLSRRNLQIVAFYVGARDLKSAQALWERVPSPWRDSLRFTDGYRVYVSLFQEEPIRHCRCLKQDKHAWGETSPVEGANNALRQGVSYLGRKSLAFARSLFWLTTRIRWFIHQWNLRQAKKCL